MRELIRGLLMLFLAVGLSTVFVGCDVDDDEGAGGADASEHDHGGDHHEGGVSETQAEANDAADSEIAQMMMQVEDDDVLDSNGALGDGCRNSNGVYGYCSNTDETALSYSDCEGNGGTLETGSCSGSANVVCCGGYQCGPSSDPTAGICAPESSCDVAGGASVQCGLCPGGATIKCCLPSAEMAATMASEEADSE